MPGAGLNAGQASQFSSKDSGSDLTLNEPLEIAISNDTNAPPCGPMKPPGYLYVLPPWGSQRLRMALHNSDPRIVFRCSYSITSRTDKTSLLNGDKSDSKPNLRILIILL